MNLFYPYSRLFPRSSYLLLVLLLSAALLVIGQRTWPTTAPASPDRAVIAPNFGKLPLSFVPNAGQTDSTARFQVHTMGGTIFFTPGELVLSLPRPVAESASTPTVVRARFEGANTAEMVGVERLPGIVNYFSGNDATEWRTHIPTYAAIVYRELYPGIDLRYDGENGALKGTYIVAPSADPNLIQFTFEGVDRLEIDEQGDLILYAPDGEIRQEAPYICQESDGIEQAIAGRYVLKGKHLVGFQIADYDSTKPLLIDPSLGYSTYLGGSSSDGGASITVDASFHIFLTGGTGSTDFPTENPAQETYGGGSGDVFVTKLDRHGTGIIYSTFLGGSDYDWSSGIVVDEEGNAYIVGTTESSDFPTTAGAFDRSFGAGPFAEDAFVVKLNPTGSELVYATYLGGSSPEEGHGIAVDGDGNAYVTGPTQSEDFPTENPFQAALANNFGYADAFVTKLNASGSALVYSTYLGGDQGANGYGIAVDDSGNAYVTGATSSTDFPTKSPLQATHSGGADAFVTKFDSTGTALVYSTYLGGLHNDYGLAIALDITNNAHVAGTTSSDGFPTVRAVQPTFAGTWDGFVAQLNAAGSGLNYSTFLGGSEDEEVNSIALDPFRNVYVVGQTRSTDFPTAAPDQAANAGEYDVFMTRLHPTGWGLAYSTYLGGSGSDYGQDIAVDAAGNAYLTGSTYSSDFPTTAGAIDDSYDGGDAFVIRMSHVVGTLVGYVPPTGGALSSTAEGVSFVFPSGAFTKTVQLTYSLLEADQNTGALAGIGHTFDLTAVYSDTGRLAKLTPGASYTATVTYTTSGPAIEDTLALYCWDGSGWVKEPTSQLNLGDNTVTATPDHFSAWALLGETNHVYLPLIKR
jgi:hypothetical protein